MDTIAKLSPLFPAICAVALFFAAWAGKNETCGKCRKTFLYAMISLAVVCAVLWGVGANWGIANS
jgi:hypothetical protein